MLRMLAAWGVAQLCSLRVDLDGPLACTATLRPRPPAAPQVPCGSGRQTAEVKKSSSLLPKLQQPLELLQLRLRTRDGPAPLILHNAARAYAAVCALLGLRGLAPRRFQGWLDRRTKLSTFFGLTSSAHAATPSTAVVGLQAPVPCPHDEAVLLPACCAHRSVAGLHLVEGSALGSLLLSFQRARLDCLPLGSPKPKVSASRTSLS